MDAAVGDRGVKALVCGRCGDIQALQEEWRECKCGQTAARWTDPQRGLAEFRVPADGVMNQCFVLGLNNHLLVPAMEGRLGMFQDFRHYHELATDAPNHVFDKSRAGCWAVVFRVGTTNDVTWAETPG